MWPAQSTLIINHYGLNMADPEARKILREQMEEFFFGADAKMPEGWEPESAGGGWSKSQRRGRSSTQEMRASGDILLISCYELGHQPFHLASLLACFSKMAMFLCPVDTAVETLTDEAISKARFVAISVPMHTALRLGEQIAQRVRSVNPSAHICFYGLYASAQRRLFTPGND